VSVEQERRAADLRSWIAGLVRSGLGTPDEVRGQVLEAVRADLPTVDAEAVCDTWIREERIAWASDAATWPPETDHDRLERVFAALESRGVAVLVGCPDHWSARDLLATTTPTPRGVVWFTPPDVWHAVAEGMLEVNLWHGTTANAAPGDALLDEVVGLFALHGLAAHFDEGRIEVAASWRCRPTTGASG
jgi:hypothetical protein